MSYLYVRAVCLFCNETVEGAEECMNKANNYKYQNGQIVWLEKAAENDWAYYDDVVKTENELHRGARFYLCPKHQTLSDWQEAFRWNRTHTLREEVLNAFVTEENVRKKLRGKKGELEI